MPASDKGWIKEVLGIDSKREDEIFDKVEDIYENSNSRFGSYRKIVEELSPKNVEEYFLLGIAVGGWETIVMMAQRSNDALFEFTGFALRQALLGMGKTESETEALVKEMNDLRGKTPAEAEEFKNRIILMLESYKRKKMGGVAN